MITTGAIANAKNVKIFGQNKLGKLLMQVREEIVKEILAEVTY